jgi:acyl dehydratase
LLGSWAVSWLGPDAVRRLRVRFREPVVVGDTLTCTGTLAELRDEDGERLADLELTCTRQTGGVAAQGWATFCLERSSP